MSKNDPFQQAQAMLETLDTMNQAQASNPNYRAFGPDYETRCQAWAQRDRWSVDEAANLLCGTDPQRPLALKGAEHTTLNEQIQALRVLISRADLPKAGKFAPTVPAKDLIAWARKKGLEIPPPLLQAMGQKAPGENTPIHGNALANAERRQQVLGAAVAVLVKYPVQCKDRGGKPTGVQIARIIEQHQDTLFTEGVAPFTIRTMSELINKYLRD